MRRTFALLLITTACAGGAGGSAQSRVDSLTARIDSLRNVLKVRDDSARVAIAQRRTDSIATERTRPRRLELVDDRVVVRAQNFQAYSFVLPTPGKCELTGRVEVLEGSKRDVLVLVVAADDYTNWVNNPAITANSLFSAGPQTVITFDVPLAKAGKFFLVLSNRWSILTDKTAHAHAEVTCIGNPDPVKAD